MKKISEVYNCHCCEGLINYPDKYFDVAIVDPPYGKNILENKKENFVITKHKTKTWDERVPDEHYFNELFRVSKNQIIWGGNYFNLPPTKCMIIWDKVNPMPGKFADAEIAWTSFDKPTRIYRQAWIGFGRKFLEKAEPIHPTQKPIKLYRWLLKNFASSGDKILDTHMGSQSSRIAAYLMGFDYTGYEIDYDYYSSGNRRFREYTMQQSLFPETDMLQIC